MSLNYINMKKDIEKHHGDNMGGINSWRYLFVEDCNEIPPVVDGAVHHEVTVFGGTRWYEGYCTPFTMKLKDEQKPSDHGSFHDKEFTGVIPKDRPELIDLFNSIADRKVILDITYNNGGRKLVGNKAEPLNLTTSQFSKDKVEDRNEFTISIYGEGIKKSPFYNI